MDGVVLQCLMRDQSFSQVVDSVKKSFKTEVYNTLIPRNIRLAKHQLRKPIICMIQNHRAGELYVFG